MAKIKFPTANGRQLNMHHIPITGTGTLNLCSRQVLGCIPTTRGDKYNVKYFQFSRLAPLIAPTFGSFKIRTLAFFVPAHSIWTGYRNYISGNVDSSTPNGPINFSLADLCYFLTGDLSLDLSSANTQDWTTDYFDLSNSIKLTGVSSLTALESQTKYYDLVFYNWNSSQILNAVAVNFTALGRSVWNSLICLGYNPPMRINTSTVAGSAYLVDRYSLYPLLAYARVCYDYLYPSQYVNQQGFGYLFTQKLYDKWSTTQGKQDVFDSLVQLVFNSYEQSFYTSLWARPNQVGVGSGQGVVPAVVQGFNAASVSGDLVSSNRSTRVVSGDAASLLNGSTSGLNSSIHNDYVSNLTPTMLRWLTSVSDFVTRNNLGGARFREFMRSHFGYNTQNDTCDESVFIESFVDSVDIGEVTNLTSSDGSSIGVLGEMAGKGSSSSKKTHRFKFEAKESGFLIFVTDVKPIVGYPRGDRAWARAIKSRFDLYTPEFDGVGMEGVPYEGIVSDFRSFSEVQAVTQPYNGVFGFAPRYSERYKIGQDNLFGDFVFNSRSNGMNAWHTLRDVLYGRTSVQPLALDSKFLHVDNQYQRIFRYTSPQSQVADYNLEDKIFCYMLIDVTKYSTQKSLGESVPLFETDGQKASTGYEGTDIK